MAELNFSDVARVFGNRVREARLVRKRWSQAELAARVEELGVRCDQGRVAKLEGGSIARLSIRDVFAFALALDVAPLNLLVPLEDELDVDLSPEVRGVPAGLARAWFRGDAVLPPLAAYKGTDLHTYLAEMPERDLRELIERSFQGKPRATLAELLAGTSSSADDPIFVEAIVRAIRAERTEREGDDGQEH